MVAALRASLSASSAGGAASCPKAGSTAVTTNRTNENKGSRLFMFSSYRSLQQAYYAPAIGARKQGRRPGSPRRSLSTGAAEERGPLNCFVEVHSSEPENPRLNPQNFRSRACQTW